MKNPCYRIIRYFILLHTVLKILLMISYSVSEEIVVEILDK